MSSHRPAWDAEFMTVALVRSVRVVARASTDEPSRARSFLPGWAVGPSRRRRRATPPDRPRDLPSRGRRDRRTPFHADVAPGRGRGARPEREASRGQVRTGGTNSRDSRRAVRGDSSCSSTASECSRELLPISANLAVRPSDGASPGRSGHSRQATMPGRSRARPISNFARQRSRALIHCVSSTFAQDCRSRTTASTGKCSRRVIKTSTPTVYPTIANAAQSISRERVEPTDKPSANITGAGGIREESHQPRERICSTG